MTYPEHARGDHEVVLELVVTTEGAVESAVAVRGEPPFSTLAEQAALGWTFEPARRGDQPIKAKIRFLVTFVEPEAQPVAPERLPTEPTPPAADAEGRARAETETEAPKPPEVYEVEVHGERPGLRRELTQAEIKEMPGAFGDPFRAIEALPGVVPIVSGVPYFYVRGAPPGNVGYFFDGIPVPALYHFAAGPGVLHPSLVERVDLYAGAYPARFGRFAGGIVAGEMAPPGSQTRGEASVRIIDSGGMVETPILGGRGNAMAGGRYSYTATVLSLLVPDITVNYWDYQSRIGYQLDDDDRIEVFGFGSGDYIAEDVQEADGTTRTRTIVDLGFHRLDLRWDRQLEKGSFRQALMLGLDETRVDSGNVLFTNKLVGLRSELRHQASPTVLVRSGADFLFERLGQKLEQEEQDVVEPAAADPSAPPDPSAPGPDQGVVEGDGGSGNDDIGLDFDRHRSDFVFGVYTDLVIDATKDVEVTPGLRSDLFVSGDDFAVGVDPRITARFAITDKLTLTHGFGIVHQAPSFVIPIPGVKPSLQGGLQRAFQYSSGVEYELPHGFLTSLVLFQNLFFNMTDLIGLAQLNETNDGEDAFRMTGRGVGAEMMIRRSLTRDLGGFLSYTLTRSERSAGRLEGPSTTDRSHVLNLAASYNLGRNWRLGGRLLFYSGIPARVAYVEAAKDPPRTPPFWRLDWRLQKRWPSADGKGYWGLVFEVLNTTLNKEVLDRSCNAFQCSDEEIGPVTIPSVGVEAAF